MTSFLTKAALGLTLGATALTAAAPADAQRYRGGYRGGGGYGYHDRGGTAVVAGIAGLAIGAALASGANDRYRSRYYADRGYAYDYDDRYYQQRGYYPNDGYYADRYRGYRGCHIERRYDRYYGRSVQIRVCG